jgi:hypothetical protein
MLARFPTVPPDAGHYESLYIKAAHPSEPLAVWIRHTVHQQPGHEPIGSTWFTLFDGATDTPYAVKETRPPGELATGGGDLVRTGAGAGGPHRTTGDIAGEGRRAAWDLAIDGPPRDAFPYLPHPALYRAPLPRTKAVAARPRASFTGTLEAGGRHLDLTGWRGMVGHNWGAEHAERWIWVHGAGLDAIFGRIRVGPVLTPWIANGMLDVDGRRHRLGGLLRRARVEEAPDRLSFAIAGPDRLDVRGELTAPREQIAGWVYADPGGGEHHSLHCSIARLTLTVGGRRLPPDEHATYELGVRERDHGIAIQPFPDP